MKENDFGKLIGTLLSYVGAKNYSLAIELDYDVSYISKMINSKIYPSSKNANVICQKIGRFIAREATDSARYAIEKYLDTDTAYNEKEDIKEQFAKAVENRLFEAYISGTQKTYLPSENTSYNSEALKDDDNIEADNSYTVVNPRLRRKFLEIPLDDPSIADKPLELIVLVNMFELCREDKLHLAGIKKDKIDNFRPERLRFKLILSICDTENMDIIFDPILFMYMVSNFSSATFEIHATNFAFYSLALSAKGHFTHFGIPGREGKCIIATTSYDSKVIEDTFDTLEEVIATNAHPVFGEYTMKEMITGKQYMRSIIGKNIRVLMGTMSEIFLPSVIFAKIAKDNFGDNEEMLEELKNIDVVLNNATYNSEMSVLLYEQTLHGYVISGEISFFGKKIKLSLADRKEHVKYIIDIINNNPNIKIKIIKGYFIEEFKQYDNPSCFLSSISNYLRISSKHTDKAFFVIKDNKIGNIFDRFFDEAWNNRKDVVSDNDAIPTLEQALNYIELMEMGITAI